MMGWTDRHCRYFLRLLSPHALLYTEMVTTGALLHGHRRRLLAFDAAEQPLALQLGGSEPDALAACARVAQTHGFREVNLNCGCPSERVQSGAFGACLMREPSTVADCVSAMRAETCLPVTVKCRIGVDDQEDYPALRGFVVALSAAGCRTVIVHARKAWLKGVSPKQNRELPPLRYDLVHRLKQELPGVEVIINGGIRDLDQVHEQLTQVDGVMLGREAYHNPWRLAEIDRALRGGQSVIATREAAVVAMLTYIERELSAGARLAEISRHMLGLFHGCAGARAWRRHLGEHARLRGAGPEVVEQALRRVSAASQQHPALLTA